MDECAWKCDEYVCVRTVRRSCLGGKLGGGHSETMMRGRVFERCIKFFVLSQMTCTYKQKLKIYTVIEEDIPTVDVPVSRSQR